MLFTFLFHWWCVLTLFHVDTSEEPSLFLEDGTKSLRTTTTAAAAAERESLSLSSVEKTMKKKEH